MAAPQNEIACKLPIRFDTAASGFFKDADGNDFNVNDLEPAEVKRFGEYIATCVNNHANITSELNALRAQLRLTSEMLAATRVVHVKDGRLENTEDGWIAIIYTAEDKESHYGPFASAPEAYAAIKPVQQGD